MNQIYDIRLMHDMEGKSIRSIARETGFDRATISKYVNQEDFSPDVPIKQKRSRKTDPYRALVKQWLLDDFKAPRKQRHTAQRVYDRLLELHKKGDLVLKASPRTIRSLVAELREEVKQETVVYLPLDHPTGEAQIDFGELSFYEKGVLYQGYLFAMTFPYSDAKFVQIFKGQNFQCLAQAMNDIFFFIGRSPRVIWLDNMSTAVKKILADGEREVTDNFRRLQCHFSFESNFCNPAAGYEKGSVENYVGTARRNYFVPIPHFDDIEIYNQELLTRCYQDLNRQHYKKKVSVYQLFQEDLEAMASLPSSPFEAVNYQLARTNRQGMVTYHTNAYSSASHLVSKEVVLKIGAHTVEILTNQAKSIIKHPRLYGHKQESMIWGPYLSALSKKPKALKYTNFFTGLPSHLQTYFEKSDLSATKRVLQEVVKQVETYDYERVIGSLDQAVARYGDDTDDVISAFHFHLHPPLDMGTVKNPVPHELEKIPEYAFNLDVYQSLLEASYE